MRSIQSKSILAFAGTLAIAASLTSVAIASNSEIVASQTAIAGDLIAGGQRVALAGTFIAAEAPTTGRAKVVEEGGHYYLELDAAFSTTDQAPDLHVLLETAATPPMSYTNFNSYVNLGSLQGFTGAQRYPLPDAIDPAQFKSVVIWCRMANATMGYAPLR